MTTDPQQKKTVSTTDSSKVTELSDVIAEISEIEVRDFINLPSGKVLTESLARALARSRPVQWVVIAGPVGAGKTTLLTTLYELFQLGLVNNYQFAGSNTLPAFEEYCHLSRIESENTESDTARTLYDPENPAYLHLRIGADHTPRSSVDLLFTDVSGEMFEDVRNSTSRCKELLFLRRASYFLILLDSRKCLRLDMRNKVVQDAKTILQSCLDSEMLSNRCIVKVVWSKFDYYMEAGDTAEHKRFQEEVFAKFRTAFGNRVTDLRFGYLASRPTRFGLGIGYGVKDLLEEWITLAFSLKEINLVPEIYGTRESELFGRRTLHQ